MGTCVRPSQPGLNQSNPERSFYQQSSSEVCENMIVEDGQCAVLIQTSVDCSEPVHRISVNLVTCGIVHNSIVTASLCNIDTNQDKQLDFHQRTVQHSVSCKLRSMHAQRAICSTVFFHYF